MQIIGADLTSVDTTPLHALGQTHSDDKGKEYRYVKLRNETATVSGVAGDVVGYLNSPASAEERFTVVTDNTDASLKPVMAGVLTASVAGVLATAYCLWVQCKGPVVVNQTIAGSPADGDGVFLSTTDRTLTLATAADDPVCGHALDVSANLVYLNCV